MLETLKIFNRLNVNTAAFNQVQYGIQHLAKDRAKSDQCRFLGNCLPTPSLSQHYHLLLTWGKNVVLGKGAKSLRVVADELYGS